MAIELKIKSETGKLKEVIIGYPYNFHKAEVEIVNTAQAKYYVSKEKPTIELLAPEFEEFKKQLETYGVAVHTQQPVEGVPDQLTPRDIGFVVDDVFVVGKMANKSRKHEWKGISYLINKMSKVYQVPEGAILEGGDIIIDKGNIYVGLSQRSTIDGVKFLKKHFPAYNIIPVHLKGLSTGENVLHLDCAFMPIGKHSALIYKGGFIEIPKTILRDYKLIEVTKREQEELTTNLLPISHMCVISRPQSTRVNELMEREGINVIKIKFDEALKTGGSFRCCTLPLYRD